MIKTQHNHKQNILLFFILLLLYVLFSELVFSLLGFNFFVVEFFRNIHQAFIYLGIVFLLNIVIASKLNKTIDWTQNPIRRFTIQSFLFSIAANALVASLFICFRYIQFFYWNHDVYLEYRTLIIQFCLFAFVIELGVVADLGRYLLNQWHQNKLQQETFDKEKAQFNLELLRNQINPHFLFNNLNTLSSLIYDNQDQAADFLRMLSKVYRNILEYRNRETVSLKEELDFFENYYQLLSIRFKDMLLVEQTIDPSLLNKNMIPLTLQLLIENAIKHNVVSKTQPLVVTIKTKGNQLIVSNPIQKKESLEFSSGLGLKILTSRYAYFGESKFEVINNNDEFIVKIPLI